MLKKKIKESLKYYGAASLFVISPCLAHQNFNFISSEKLINALDRKYRLNLSPDEEIGLKKAFKNGLPKNHTTILSSTNDQIILQALSQYVSIENKSEVLIVNEFLERVNEVEFERQDPAEAIRFLGESFTNYARLKELGINEVMILDGGSRTEIVDP